MPAEKIERTPECFQVFLEFSRGAGDDFGCPMSNWSHCIIFYPSYYTFLYIFCYFKSILFINYVDTFQAKPPFKCPYGLWTVPK